MATGGAGCSGSTNVPFKKAGGRSGIRKRARVQPGSDEGSGRSSSDDETAVVAATRFARDNPLIQSTKAKARRAARAEASDDDSEAEQRAALLGVQYKSDKTAERAGPTDMGATALSQIETDYTHDAQSQFERAHSALKEQKGQADDKIYRGLSTYGSQRFFEKKDSAAGNAAHGFVRKGPIRAPQFMRQTVRWDYKPDLCKDYKETGFCGFGDSCKFLHDRTDYKHGWEIERDWEEGRYGADDAKAKQFEISDDEDELPFKCFLCRDSFTDPVVTKCSHYFCEKCALAHFAQSHKCYVCDKETGGVFNPAKEIMARTKGEKRRRDGDESPPTDDSDASLDDTPVETLPPPPDEGAAPPINCAEARRKRPAPPSL